VDLDDLTSPPGGGFLYSMIFRYGKRGAVRISAIDPAGISPASICFNTFSNSRR